MTLEDDLARQLTDLARESHKPFKAVVNEALRRGLGDSASLEPEFRLHPHAGHLQPGIDDRRFNELAWELDQSRISPASSDRDL